ncbi:MAG: ATP-binding cassette domain-containing protein [Chitinivibrionales bacterium]|nr:ATP-binding cassette domain-containing protein [Chitinivibrionales bacterium]
MHRIAAKNITKTFLIGYAKRQGALARCISMISGKEPQRRLTAIDNISFCIGPGEITGLIGANASGKSTLLRIIAGIHPVDSGTLTTEGTIISLINLHAGLKDRLLMKDNIGLCASLFGLDKKGIVQRYDSMIAFSGLEAYTGTKIYQFSSGMRQRLVFSIAVHCNPDIILLDEDFEVGDETFRIKSMQKLKELQGNGTTIILASHNLKLVQEHCTSALWLQNGKIERMGESSAAVDAYQVETGKV